MGDNTNHTNTYMEIWKVEQDHSRTRWTVTTFFLSVSFAILGISFQTEDVATNIFGLAMPDVQRITGLLIFWFGFALFVQFNRYTGYLRGQLRKMEEAGQVPFRIQSDADIFMYSKLKAAFAAQWLLVYFGVTYMIIVFAMMFYA